MERCTAYAQLLHIQRMVFHSGQCAVHLEEKATAAWRVYQGQHRKCHRDSHKKEGFTSAGYDKPTGKKYSYTAQQYAPSARFCSPVPVVIARRRTAERESHVTVWLGHYKGVFLLSLLFLKF